METPEINDDARQILQLARQAEAMKMNPAWTKIMKDLKSWRDDALQTIEDCASSDARVRSNLLYRYQQRDSCIDFIESRMRSIAEARSETIRLIAEMNGVFGSAAEDLVAALEGRPQ